MLLQPGLHDIDVDYMNVRNPHDQSFVAQRYCPDVGTILNNPHTTSILLWVPLLGLETSMVHDTRSVDVIRAL